MTDTMIAALESKGFKRWTKGVYDRLYIRSTLCGLELSFYNTGNIRSAKLNGDPISNCRARKLREGKNYIDLADGSVHACCSELEQSIMAFLDKMQEEAQA